MRITEILTKATESKASDIFIIAGAPVTIKCRQKLVRLSDEILKPVAIDELVSELYIRTTTRKFEGRDDDFVMIDSVLHRRFRVNVYHQRGSIAIVIRLIEFDRLQSIPAESLCIGSEILNLADRRNGGLILISGPPCCGKTTTAAYMIDKISHESQYHIITIEDPIEYLHKHSKSLVSQRELSIDIKTYSDAMHAAVRESPDVIFIGEIRDKDSLTSALNAADTGVLVISTVHAQSGIDTVSRVLDMFHGNEQSGIRLQIARVLRAIVSQQLVETELNEHGFVPIFEILVANTAVKTLIRNNNLAQLSWVLKSGKSYGMISYEESLSKALTSGLITRETYDKYCSMRIIGKVG